MTTDAEQDPAVAEAVERLYRVFARYPLPTRLDAAPSRDADATLRALHSAPLRQLGAKQVLPYAGWAMSTVGGPNEYRHFLPRIVELALDDAPHPSAKPWMIAHKVTYPPCKDRWSEEEREAARAAFLAVWKRALTEEPMARDAEKWLCGLAHLGRVTDALDLWRGSASPHALEHFAEFVTNHQQTLLDGHGISVASWDAVAPEIRNEIIDWIGDADLTQMLCNSALPSDHWIRWWVENDRKALRPNGTR